MKSQVYRGITKLLLVRELNWRHSAQVSLSLSNLCKFAIFELADTHHLIRAASIRLLSVLSSILHQVHQYKKERNTRDEEQNVRSRSEAQAKSGASPSDGQHLDIIEIQRIISHYVVDSDQRVRKVISHKAMDFLWAWEFCFPFFDTKSTHRAHWKLWFI